MRVLIGCESSGTVRDAFIRAGHDAVSCDLLPSDAPGPHLQCDVRDVLGDGWDCAIFHPPCTHLAVSGAAHFPAKIADGRQQAALDFVRLLLSAKIPKIALENPVSVISSAIRKPDQIIHPWQFGHRECKATCLWLIGLPLLVPTSDLRAETFALPDRERQRLHYLPPSPDRWKLRSKTYDGIAAAMAAQWGGEALRPFQPRLEL